MINTTALFMILIICMVIFTGSTNHSAGISVPASKENIISCAPSLSENFYTDAQGKYITVMPGWGNHVYTISAKNDSSQFYFNQGLSMYYSYHSREAIASFKEAARFDSTCAMAYWGEALAMGPGYNSTYRYSMGKNAPAAVEQMSHAILYALPKEKDLMEVMKLRYNIDDNTDAQRKNLNEAYAAGMKQMMQKYAGDDEIKALYIDAVMLIHAWDFWNNDGTPKPWTPELVSFCEDILKKNPQHPGALHYYIHLTEASHNPQVALYCADSLKKLFPGIAHMVHMASHEYERTGMYAQGVDVNEKADDNLVTYHSLASNLFSTVHIAHYFAVEAYCALSGGMYQQAMDAGGKCRKTLTPDYKNTNHQYLYMLPVIAQVRLGKWQQIIDDTETMNSKWVYSNILNDFAKGMAYAHTGNIAAAKKYVSMLHEKMSDTILKVRDIPFNTPYEAAAIAENILNSNILFAQKKYKQAISSLQKAISIEDKMIYVEPKDWMLPPRQYLGTFLMKMKKPAQAEKVYREDIAHNPGNGWSLLGLYQSLMAQHKDAEAETYKQQYEISFSHADQMPASSVY